MVSQTFVPQSSSSGHMSSTKTALAQFFKEKNKHDHAKDVASKVLPKPSEETKDLLSHGGAQMPASSERGLKYVSDKWPPEMQKGKYSTWDAALRAVAGPSADVLKDYRIPKKSDEVLARGSTSKYQSEVVPTNSENEAMSTSSSLHHSKTHSSQTTDSRSIVTPSMQFSAHSSYMQHVHKPPVPSTCIGSTMHTVPASSSNMLFTKTVTRPTFTGLSAVSTVKQLASKPANKSLVSPVRSDNSTEPPFSSFTRYNGNQQQARSQVKTPSPPSSHQVSQPTQRQPFTHFAEAATYQQQSHRIHSTASTKTHQQHEFHGYHSSDGKASQDAQAQAIPSTSGLRDPNTGKAPVKQSSVIQGLNQHSPPNAPVHSVKSQKKDPGAAPIAAAATVLPLSATEVEAARSSLGQDSSNQSTGYLGSFVADPDKPWPSLSVPEVMSHLESSQAASFPQDLVQVNPPSLDSVQPSRISQYSGQKYSQFSDEQTKRTSHLQQPSSIENASEKVPTRHPQKHLQKNYRDSQHLQKDNSDSQQHLQKDYRNSQQRSSKDYRDSQIEMYSTHKSPTHERKKHQTSQEHSPQEVMIVPQLKDIEVEQMNILSNLRKKVGLGETPSKQSGTCQSQSDDKKVLGDEKGTDGQKSSDISDKRSTSISREALKFQCEIGRVIENVVRSDQFRQKEKKSTCLLSSQSTNEKTDSSFVVETPAKIDKSKANISENKESPKQAVSPSQYVSGELISGAKGENSSNHVNVPPRNLEVASNCKSEIVNVNSEPLKTDSKDLKASENEEKQHIDHTSSSTEPFKSTEVEKVTPDEDQRLSKSGTGDKVEEEIVEKKAEKVARRVEKHNKRRSSEAQSSSNEFQDKLRQSPKGREVKTRDVIEEFPDDNIGRKKEEKIEKVPESDEVVAKSKNSEKLRKSGESIAMDKKLIKSCRESENIAMAERVEKSPKCSESIAMNDRVDKSPRGSEGIAMAERVDKSPRASENIAMVERVDKSPRVSERVAMVERLDKSPRGSEGIAMVERVDKSPRVSERVAMVERVDKSPRGSEGIAMTERVDKSPRGSESIAMVERVDKSPRGSESVAMVERVDKSPRGSESVAMVERVDKSPRGSKSTAMAEIVEKSPRDSEDLATAGRVEKSPGDSEDIAMTERVEKSPGDSENIAIPERVEKSPGDNEDIAMPGKVEKSPRGSEDISIPGNVEKSPGGSEGIEDIAIAEKVEKSPVENEDIAMAQKVEKSPGGSEGIAVAKRMENSFVDSENIGKRKKEEVKEANTEQNETKLKSKEISSEKLGEKQLQEIGNNKELLTAKPKEITGNGEIEETKKPIAKEIVSVKGKINYFKCRHYSIAL